MPRHPLLLTKRVPSAPLEKLTALLDDIFEAEDNVSPDAQVSDLPTDFFSPLTTDPARPLLHPDLIRKLTKYISKVARPTKRIRLSSWEGSGGTPRRAGGMAEVEINVLSRILKLLERSVKAGEDLEPFGGSMKRSASEGGATGGSPSKASKAKGTKKKADGDAKRSKSPAGDGDRAEEDSRMSVDDSANVELTEEDFTKLELVLEVARDSILAADCCIALLTSDRLTKQVCYAHSIFECSSLNFARTISCTQKNLSRHVLQP